MSELAAIRYLASKRPDRYRLEITHYRDPATNKIRAEFTLEELKRHTMEGFEAWTLLYSLTLPQRFLD